jgi:hypothetical protein
MDHSFTEVYEVQGCLTELEDKLTNFETDRPIKLWYKARIQRKVKGKR